MRSDFAALILTHGRPRNQMTLAALKRFGFTGRVYLVVDDEDPTLPEYRARYGDQVLVFSKAEVEPGIDLGDNLPARNTVLYARNAAFALARSVGARYFVQLDDDYKWFHYRFDGAGRYGTWDLYSLDWLFERLVEYLAATPFAAIAISQGGDHIGGGGSSIMSVIGSRRKAMNSFVCDTERPFRFVARMNDDVSTYTALQRAGLPFLTFLAPQLVQEVTQAQGGGLTEMYASAGTYVKSFYSVMMCPSAVKIASVKSHAPGKGVAHAHARIHHKVNWEACAPAIIEEKWRKHA